MRKVAFWLSLVLIFVIPWEDSVSLGTLGSIARLMGFVVAGLWLFTVLTEGRIRGLHAFHLLVILFFVWNVVTLFWTASIDRTMSRVQTYAQMFLLLLILWELYVEPQQLTAGLQAYVLGGFVSITSTIINYVKGNYIGQYEMRFSASGVNAVDLAVLLILGLPLAWHLLLLERQKGKWSIRAWVNLAYLPLATFAVALTGSRTTLFALLPVVLYIIVTGWNKPLWKLLIFIVVAIAVFVLYFYLPPSIIDRFGTTIASIRAADLGGRVSLWEGAVRVASTHPLTGAGSGTMGVLLGGIAHNTFLSVLAETGVVGLTLFLALFAVALWQLPSLDGKYAALWAAVLSSWVIGALSLSWEFRKPTWLFLSLAIIQWRVLVPSGQTQKIVPAAPPDVAESGKLALKQPS